MSICTTTLRLAVLPDFREENWPSMDLFAEMLAKHMDADWNDKLKVELVCPPFRRRMAASAWTSRRGWAVNADRFLNRHWDFPRHVGGQRTKFDMFHICDHSYGQLALGLPPERTGVFCHDLDAFRCLLAPDAEPRPSWFRWMMLRVLRGLRRAAVVFHTTQAVRDEILRYRLIGADKLVQAPPGHADEFKPAPRADKTAAEILGRLQGKPYLLHVGSCIQRKRVEFLLEVFAAVRAHWPALHLLKVGGTWTTSQKEEIRRLGAADALVHVHDASRATLACLYQQAAMLLLPSNAEGFGLPVVEALACGTPVLASDLPVLREVGGSAAWYAPLHDPVAWRDQVLRLRDSPGAYPSQAARWARALRFTWQEHARIIAETYLGLVA